jgi:hypothetical protein
MPKAKKSTAFQSIRCALLEARDFARGKKTGARIHKVRIVAPNDLPRPSRRK